MYIWRPALVLGVLFFIAISTYAQDSETPTITLRRQQSDDFGYDYWVDNSELRLVEIVIPDEQTRDTEFRKRRAKLSNCSKPTRLFYKGKAVGRSYLCSRDDSRVLLYSYGEKIYEVGSDTEATINRFTKRVLPLACQLHGDKGCVSMFY